MHMIRPIDTLPSGTEANLDAVKGRATTKHMTCSMTVLPDLRHLSWHKWREGYRSWMLPGGCAAAEEVLPT